MSNVDASTADLARSWHHAFQEAPCDRVAPWDHGTVVQARRHPDFYFHNSVRVEDDVSFAADELVTLANDALGETCRLIVFDHPGAAERLVAPMTARGWRASRLVLMRHVGRVPNVPATVATIAEIDYDDVHSLRTNWHREDFPDSDPASYLASKRAIDRDRGSTVLAPLVEGVPVGYAELARDGTGAEITQVYVAPEHRGQGLGTAITREAIELGSSARDLWISADHGGPPERLYARLGFRPSWTNYEFLLMA